MNAKPACSPRTAELFFSDNPVKQERAKRICARCPLLVPCEQGSRDEPFGIWGGRTAEERGFDRTGKRLGSRRPLAKTA